MAIDAAEKGDYSVVNRLLQLLKQPFRDEEHVPEAYLAPAPVSAAAGGAATSAAATAAVRSAAAAQGALRFDAPPPAWAAELCVT